MNMGTFINEVCISCLQLLKTLYVCLLFWASLYAICTYVCSYLILARIKKVFLHACLYIPRFWLYHRLRTPRESFFFQKLETFGLGQTNWAEILCGIWGISGQTISTIFNQNQIGNCVAGDFCQCSTEI